jgi:iron-sulfur cluster assembly accessory protein
MTDKKSNISDADQSKVFLTEHAKKATQDLLSKNKDYEGKSLRLYLEGKGCDGFYYGVTFDDAQLEDHRFPQELTPQSEIDVIVDPDTLQFVSGSTIDWVNDERGQGFLVNNPSQRAFRGKFFKRKSWLEKFSPQQDTSIEQ